MVCPRCGERPLPFGRLLRTINPMRITCAHCSAQLAAGSMAYIWTALHVPLAIGLVWIRRELYAQGAFQVAWAPYVFYISAIALVFATAYVIPWFGFARMYREAS